MDRRGLIEVTLASVISLIMSIIGPVMVLFLLPLQILAKRCGEKAFIYSAAGLTFGTIVLKVNLMSGVANSGILIIVDSMVILLLILGLYVLNFKLKESRIVLKLLVLTISVGLIAIPTLYYLGRNSLFLKIMIDQLNGIIQVFQGTYRESGGLNGESIFSSLSGEDLYEIFKHFFLNFFLYMYFSLLALNWWLGNLIADKSMGKGAQPSKIKEFCVPEKLVWFYFIPLTIKLIELLFRSKGLELELGLFAYAVSNSLYVMGTLYILQGFGLLQFLMEKRGFSPLMIRTTKIFLILSILLMGGLNIIALILSGLGVSELWINYRHKEKELIQ